MNYRLEKVEWRGSYKGKESANYPSLNTREIEIESTKSHMSCDSHLNGICSKPRSLGYPYSTIAFHLRFDINTSLKCTGEILFTEVRLERKWLSLCDALRT